MKLVVGLVSVATMGVSVAAGVPSAVSAPSSAAGRATSGHVAASVRPTLVVVILGRGSVGSKPAGISCPGKCTATFPAGTSVLLTPKSKSGSPFLRWGGSCVGTRACRVKVSALSAVAAQFAPAPTTQPPPTRQKSVAEPGAYSLYNASRTFFVAPGGRNVLNIAIAVSITCTPAATSAPTGDYLTIARAAIGPGGSFAGKGSQRGLLAGFPATFTYSFAGHFTAATASAAASAAGSFREDVVFKDNVTHKCTSNTQSWSASKTGPIPPPASLVQAGKYSLYNGSRTFSVAPGGRSMLNIAIGGVPIACAPAASGAPTGDQIVIPQGAIKPDGSFAAKASQNGVFAGVPAKFTYSFAGNFQGLDPTGAVTVAGVFREDIVFTDSAGAHSCTSNDQVWRAARLS
jgi:trimeric autotransporter adhesin